MKRETNYDLTQNLPLSYQSKDNLKNLFNDMEGEEITPQKAIEKTAQNVCISIPQAEDTKNKVLTTDDNGNLVWEDKDKVSTGTGGSTGGGGGTGGGSTNPDYDLVTKEDIDDMFEQKDGE